MLPLPFILLIASATVVVVLSVSAKENAEKIRSQNYAQAKKTLAKLKETEPDVLKELYSKRDKLHPLVAEKLKKFFEEQGD